MEKRRDDFLKPVIRLLKERSGYKCSNPQCRVVTNGAGLNTGVAAHIRAAAPLGPRYDINMTPEERRSYQNGIWLCQTCSKIIDNDVSFYTINILNEWKRLAEEDARNAVGRKVLNEQCASDMLAMALNGYPKSYISQTIKNAHNASEKSLEALDPRFNVTSSFEGGLTKFSICAKENVPLKVSVKNYKNYKRKYQELVSKGVSFSIDMNDVTTSGSSLIETITKDSDGILTISSQDIDVVMKISLTDSISLVSEALAEVHGKLFHGLKAFTFSGQCFSNLLNVKAVFPCKGDKTKFNMHVDFEKWSGLNILNLPFFNKIKSIYDRICDGWDIEFSLEFNGDEFISGLCNSKVNNNYFKRVTTLLSYTDRARTLSHLLNISLEFSPQIKFTSDEHIKLRKAISRLREEITLDTTAFNSLPKFTLIACEENVNMFKGKGSERSHFAMESVESEKISVFSREIELYRVRHEYLNVSYIFNKNINNIKYGDEFEVQLVACENFSYIEKYILPE